MAGCTVGSALAGVGMKRDPWTLTDIETLTRLYPDTLTRDIATRLNRPIASLYSMAQKLGLRKSDTFFAGPNSGRITKARSDADRARRGYTPWSQDELDTLRRLYPNKTTNAVALMLGRSVSSTYQAAYKLGLSKSAEFLSSPESGRTDGNRGKSTRFPKGNVPANKGLRRPGYAPGRMAETQFKKGMAVSDRHNYLPIGSVRVTRDGILQRKVTDDPSIYPARRWTPVTRLVWEAMHGPIPPKHMVVFKPGMHTVVESEITVDRLECISRAEHMRRNTIHNYPPEIKGAMTARAALNRRINHVEKHQ